MDAAGDAAGADAQEIMPPRGALSRGYFAASISPAISASSSCIGSSSPALLDGVRQRARQERLEWHSHREALSSPRNA